MNSAGRGEVSIALATIYIVASFLLCFASSCYMLGMDCFIVFSISLFPFQPSALVNAVHQFGHRFVCKRKNVGVDVCLVFMSLKILDICAVFVCFYIVMYTSDPKHQFSTSFLKSQPY